MSEVALAQGVLLVHLVVILFNIAGLILIPIGGWLGWRFVRVFWWRALHLLSLAVVALQAAFGRACFLTSLQDHLMGQARGSPPLIMGWINRMIFWPLPMWVFTAIYLLVGVYALSLWWGVAPYARRSPWAERACDPPKAG